MKRLEIPSYIAEKISRGNAILFLGAGSSYGCSAANGFQCPNGTGLGKILSDSFLGGKRAQEPLARIADYAESEAGRAAVQAKVFEVFDPIEPNDFHKIVTQFRWRAIVTTNYDRVIEKSYENSKDRLQDPVPILRNGDMARLTDNARGVPIIKIHGCITQSGDTKIPLVLANEQYVKHSSGRERLASTFKEMAQDCPVIFCGYQFQDLHIQSVLFGLDNDSIDRPQYLAINPAFDELDVRYWGKHRVNAISATYEEFLRSIDNLIPIPQRALSQLLDGSHGSISTWLKVGQSPSRSLQSILYSTLEHVHSDIPTENANAERFYRGDSRNWAPIKANLDFQRSVNSHILAELLSASKTSGTKFILLKGHAGCGKSVTLRRVAWDTAAGGKSLAFYIQDSSRRLADNIKELCDITGERINIFIDNLLNDPDEVSKAVRVAKMQGLPVTFVAGVRHNEWFVSEADLGLIADEEFTVGDLSYKEAKDLCHLLEAHDCLGDLAAYTADERPNRFMDAHDRQLLVALHEVTAGKPWREIILNEYKNILPPAAQTLYLDICTLHRLGVLARAGLISRVSGIRFETFKEKFLGPLDRVVSTIYDANSRDLAYKARHRDIAQIVFEEVLKDQSDRANQMARIAGSLNSDYESDDRAATSLLKGKLLALEFADRLLVDRIYDSAMQAGIDRTFVLQQRAIFELHHPGGTPKAAMEYIDEAIEITNKPSSSLHHTKALVYKAFSKVDGISLALRDRYLDESLTILKKHGGLKHNYTAGSICEILLIQTKRRLHDTELASGKKLEDEAALRKMTELEKALDESFQRFPGDIFLTTLKADLHTALAEQPKAVALLKRAHDANPANESVALRLARQYSDQNKKPEAISILRKTSGLNPASKTISFELAQILMSDGESKHVSEIGALLRKSFTEGDAHFEAQFWHARHEFLYGDHNRAQKIYQQFSRRTHPYIDVGKRRATVKNDDGTYKSYEGSVARILGDFAFIRVSGLADDVFLYRNEINDNEWKNLRVGDRVKFRLSFSFRGPNASNAKMAV